MKKVKITNGYEKDISNLKNKLDSRHNRLIRLY